LYDLDLTIFRHKEDYELITPELFAHLVDLAAIELKDEEKEYLRQQLNNQLNVIDELQAIPVDEKINIATHGVSYSEEMRPSLRDDIIRSYQNYQKLVEEAPESKDGYIIVPDIPHEDLS
jgi:aspartyl-tRNA(Asn)/glutamyl-tRNA(Gln) amidotransferase subunit C